MTERWQVNDQLIQIRRRRYQRTLRMRVSLDGTLHISCASTVGRREILNFITENRGFVEAQMLEAKRVQERYPPKRYEAGESFIFLGVARSLELRPDSRRPRVHIEQNRIVLEGKVEAMSDRVAAMHSFYRRCGRNYLRHRVEYFSKLMKLQPSGVSFRSQSSRWGSCSGEGHISLNWRLIASPAEVVDYVIVHELAHLKHHDHSPRFWALVAEFSPRFKDHKRWLKEHHWGLDFLAKTNR